jgi:hypothetical protein
MDSVPTILLENLTEDPQALPRIRKQSRVTSADLALIEKTHQSLLNCRFVIRARLRKHLQRLVVALSVSSGELAVER